MSVRQLVSAIIPTRNRHKLLQRALKSVISQTWPEIEIVVVDDASEDKTPDVLDQFQTEYPLKVIRNNPAKGAAASRNQAVSAASGVFIAGLDDDDEWHSDRIAELMARFHESVSAVCSYDEIVSDNHQRIWKKPGLIQYKDLLYYNQVGNQVLTKKKYITEVGGYDENLPSAQDYDLWIRLSEKFGPVVCVPKTLQTIYMDSSRQRITNTKKKAIGYRVCFEKHRKKMDETHIKYQKYRLKLAENQDISWLEMFRSVPPALLKKEITRRLFL